MSHSMPIYPEQARRIAEAGKSLDYEQEALNGLRRSWELTDPSCQALALRDAQVWATLHLARITASPVSPSVAVRGWIEGRDTLLAEDAPG